MKTDWSVHKGTETLLQEIIETVIRKQNTSLETVESISSLRKVEMFHGTNRNKEFILMRK